MNLILKEIDKFLIHKKLQKDDFLQIDRFQGRFTQTCKNAIFCKSTVFKARMLGMHPNPSYGPQNFPTGPYYHLLSISDTYLDCKRMMLKLDVIWRYGLSQNLSCLLVFEA